MKYRYAALAFFCALNAAAVTAFEPKNPESEKPRLKLELEQAPSQLQRDFDQYVQQLAAQARRDALSPPEKKDKINELQAKAVNPIVLFRW
jgi:hypothetical protein